MAYTWNEAAGRFVDARGRFVSESSVRAVVDAVAAHASDRLAVSATAMLEGRMSLAAFQASVMADTKLSMMAGGAIGKGGAAQMTQSDYGFLGHQIRDQYAYARNFAEQIADGTQPLNGSVISRARMYGQQGRIAFEAVRARETRFMAEERNVLGAAEHCSECVALSARGWVPVGTLPPIGSRQCRSNDRCHISRRSAREAAA